MCVCVCGGGGGGGGGAYSPPVLFSQENRIPIYYFKLFFKNDNAGIQIVRAGL